MGAAPATTGEILKGGHLDRIYAAVWTGDAGFEAIPVFGLDPGDHLKRCRELELEGYRMVSLSVVRTSRRRNASRRLGLAPPGGQRRGERSTGRAAGSGRRGAGPARESERGLAALTAQPDPRLRSFMINWLNPLVAIRI